MFLGKLILHEGSSVQDLSLGAKNWTQTHEVGDDSRREISR